MDIIKVSSYIKKDMNNFMPIHLIIYKNFLIKMNTERQEFQIVQ